MRSSSGVDNAIDEIPARMDPNTTDTIVLFINLISLKLFVQSDTGVLLFDRVFILARLAHIVVPGKYKAVPGLRTAKVE